MNDVVLGGEGTKENTKAMIKAQNDLYMVVANYGAESNIAKDNTLESLGDGSLTRGELQRCCINILEFILLFLFIVVLFVIFIIICTIY